MERQRKYKMFSIVALMFAVIGLSVGFAAFSKVLTINASATVTPNEDDFNIVPSGSSTDATVTTITPVLTGGATSETAEIIKDGNKFTLDSTVNFSAPGQSAKYTIYLHNLSDYVAYLKSIKFGTVGTSGLKKVCTADVEGEIDSTKLEQICEQINLSLVVQMGINQFATISEDVSFTNEAALDKGLVASGKITISYPEDAPRVDSPFSIQFGSIEFTYSTT